MKHMPLGKIRALIKYFMHKIKDKSFKFSGFLIFKSKFILKYIYLLYKFNRNNSMRITTSTKNVFIVV